MEADPEPYAVNLSFMWILYQCPDYPGHLMYFGTLTTYVCRLCGHPHFQTSIHT